jgi:hypothetical protein
MSRQADNTVTFSFDGPKHQPVDLNAIQAAISEEAGEPAPEAKADPTPPPAAIKQAQADIPEPQTQTEQAEPQPATEDTLRTFKIVVDGQELEVTEADLKAGHMRQRDYTQKTQALSAKEKALEAERAAWNQERSAVQQELAQIDAFLRNQQAMDSYYEKAFGVRRGQQVPMPQVDPNKPLTAAEVAEISRYNAEQVRISTERQIAEARQEALRAQQYALEGRQAVQREKLEVAVDAHISTLLDKYPVLKKFEDIADELMGDAARYKPRSIDEAKARLSEAAERRVATIRSIAAEEQKQAAVKAAQLKRTSPEPPGGTAPKPPAGKKLTLDSQDRKALRAAAEEDLKAFLD